MSGDKVGLSSGTLPKKMSKLENLARELGYDSKMKMLESAVTDSVCPSMCRKCGAGGEDLEPDYEGGDCDECGAEGNVASVLIIAGLI